MRPVLPPPKETSETPIEKKARKKQEVLDEHRRKQEALIAEYDPHTQSSATKNPFATLFVARLSYETTEKKLKKEFERYGPIRKVKIITDLDGKSKGYAFIEYDSESDLKKAYKQADGTKIDGRRVLVDVERARTVPNWLPRRLGGGKGPPRCAEPKKKGARSAVAGVVSGLPATQPAGGPPSYGGPPRSGASNFRGSGSGYRDGFNSSYGDSYSRDGASGARGQLGATGASTSSPRYQSSSTRYGNR